MWKVNDGVNGCAQDSEEGFIYLYKELATVEQHTRALGCDCSASCIMDNNALWLPSPPSRESRLQLNQPSRGSMHHMAPPISEGGKLEMLGLALWVGDGLTRVRAGTTPAPI